MSIEVNDLQSVNKFPKLVTFGVSKVDKFKDINEWQPQNILAIEIKLFLVMNPDKSKDIND